MSEPSQVSFDQALADTSKVKRHLLLGNGFSVALRHDIFSYKSLREQANLGAMPEVDKAFEILKTFDFERVIQALRTLAQVAPAYDADPALVSKAADQAEALKEELVRVLAEHHPALPGEVEEAQYKSCRRFLGQFVGDGRRHPETDVDLRGAIYTLNYDLLLYWTLLHEEASEGADILTHDDGFRSPEDDPNAQWVVWDGEAAYDQNIHFLHGALHLFDTGPELQKKCWGRAGQVPLMDQIRRALNDGMFPLFVSEGAFREKLARIRHHGYLHRSLRIFEANCREYKKDPAFFIFGWAMSDSDAHILKKIEKGRVPRLYVSVHDPHGDEGRDLRLRAAALAERRAAKGSPLKVFWFDARRSQGMGLTTILPERLLLGSGLTILLSLGYANVGSGPTRGTM